MKPVETFLSPNLTVSTVNRLAAMAPKCEIPTMSATVVREKRQTTLPLDVVEAAGIRVNDQIEWRFESGEIRGRKLEPRVTTITRKLVKRGNYLMMDTSGLKIDPSDIATAVREERDK